MKIRNLGTDVASPKQGETVLIELDDREMFTAEEELEELSGKVKDMDQKLDKVQEIETKLDNAIDEHNEVIKSTSLSILQKEQELQLEREKEWKKEKRNKKIKRTLRLTVLLVIFGVLVLALLGGYRIPVPDSWVGHFQGIYNTAVDYFTGEINPFAK